MTAKLKNIDAPTRVKVGLPKFQSSEASNYILDLLGELEIIAKVSNLTDLSQDIGTLLIRYGRNTE